MVADRSYSETAHGAPLGPPFGIRLDFRQLSAGGFCFGGQAFDGPAPLPPQQCDGLAERDVSDRGLDGPCAERGPADVAQ